MIYQLKRKVPIGLLVTLTALSLLGLITTQIFWIGNAIKLAEQQFDNRVTIAMQGALDEYIQLYEGYVDTTKQGCFGACSMNDSLMINLIPEVVDSLLKVHFAYHGLDSTFEFSVVKCQTNEVLYAKSGLIKDENKTSTHRISLSCLRQKESHHLEVVLGSKQHFVIMKMMAWLISSILFLAIIAFIFTYIVVTIIKQKKISEIKNDFINNMTHEFKTPIANISLASEVLLRPETKSNPEKIKQYTHIIQQENMRMKNQVERVLQVAVRNRDEMTIHPEEVNIHELITEAVENICMEECDNKTYIKYEFHAEHFILYTDPMHFSNIVHNLIDNAQKYSNDSPKILITTRNQNGNIRIDFKDNGIGIASESQKQIFEKFYRVPTGNIHNVKGFGLGLFYVKTIIEAQGGTIELKSEPGKGSCFTIIFPLNP